MNGRGIWREVDLSEATTATLSLDFNETYTSSSFTVTLAVSSNGGTTYNDLETFTFSTETVSREYDISAYLASNTRIRLLAAGNIPEDATRTMFFDNVVIAYDCAGGGSGGGSGGSGGSSCTNILANEGI